MPVPTALPSTLCAVSLALLVPVAASASLDVGSRGDAVERLNGRLAELGYLSRRDVGRRFTSATRWAVMGLQKYERIHVDGVVGPETSSALRPAEGPVAGFGSGRRIAVSLSRQLAFLVGERERVRWALSVSTGRAGYRTPRGVYRIFWRERRSWSVDYDRWLPWAAYFNKGSAFHGSRLVAARPTSHGCIRVPRPFARATYGFAGLGTKVVVR